MNRGIRLRKKRERPQTMRLAQPKRAVSMVAQLLTGVRMHQHVKCAVVQREPANHVRKLGSSESQLVAPHRVRAHGLLVNTTQLDPTGQLDLDDPAQRPGRLAAGCLEIHMRVWAVRNERAATLTR